MTPQRYLELSGEWEAVEFESAQGHDTAASDARMKEIERQMDEAPFEFHPDSGAVVGKGCLLVGDERVGRG